MAANTDKPTTDWEKISGHYRAGTRSLRDIGKEYGVTEGAIRKRAKAEGWPRGKKNEAVSGKVVLSSTDPLDAAGFVYVIYIDDSASERFYKVGMSKHFSHRFNAHQCASPFDVCVACAYFVANMRKAETEIHKKFSLKRVRGEWFRLTLEDVREIAEGSVLI
jgi:hypothetical protein